MTTETEPVEPAKREYEVHEVKGADGKVRRIPRPRKKLAEATEREAEPKGGPRKSTQWSRIALGVAVGAVVAAGGVLVLALQNRSSQPTIH